MEDKFVIWSSTCIFFRYYNFWFIS